MFGDRLAGMPALRGMLAATSLALLANPIKIGAFLGLLFDQLVAKEDAEFGNIALGRRVGGDHLEQLATAQATHLVVQHHHRLRAIEATGIEYRIGGQFGWSGHHRTPENKPALSPRCDAASSSGHP